VAFDVNDFEHELPALTIPADDILTSGGYEKTRLARKCLAEGRRALENRDAKTALDEAAQAEALNPGFYENAFLQGRALLASNRKPEAAKAFASALVAHPPFLSERKQIEELLREAGGTN
jgi:hypothetical protein